MKKLTILAAMLAMMLVAAAPAMAQNVSDDDVIDDDSVTTTQVGDNFAIETGDITSNVCVPVISQFNTVTQSTGDAVAVSGAVASGDDSVAVSGNAVANTSAFLGVSQFVGVTCF